MTDIHGIFSGYWVNGKRVKPLRRGTVMAETVYPFKACAQRAGGGGVKLSSLETIFLAFYFVKVLLQKEYTNAFLQKARGKVNFLLNILPDD